MYLWSFFVKLWRYKSYQLGKFGITNAWYISWFSSVSGKLNRSNLKNEENFLNHQSFFEFFPITLLIFAKKKTSDFQWQSVYSGLCPDMSSLVLFSIVKYSASNFCFLNCTELLSRGIKLFNKTDRIRAISWFFWLPLRKNKSSFKNV